MSSEPHRIQRQRRKRWRSPPNTIYVGGPSRWGNPWSASHHDRQHHPDLPMVTVRPRSAAQAVDLYRIWAVANFRGSPRLKELRGKNLACWCHLCERHRDGKPLGVDCPDCRPCHADVLLELANAPEAVHG